MLDFRKLEVWQKSHELAVDVCEFAAGMPSRYVRLADQLMSTSTSVPANLAEGSGRHSALDRAHFFDYSAGSASELEARLLILRDLGQLDAETCAAWCARIHQIRAMIQGLLRRLRPPSQRSRRPTPPASSSRKPLPASSNRASSKPRLPTNPAPQARPKGPRRPLTDP